MMKSEPVKEFFSYKAEQLQALVDAARKIIEQPLAKGVEGEKLLENLLIGLLPKRFRPTKGFILDSRGDISGEIDLILYDEVQLPRLFDFSSFELVPVEATSACIEVKTTLDSTELEKTLNKFLKIRNMHFNKERKTVPISNSTGAGIGVADTTYPELYVFAYDSNISNKTINNLFARHKEVGDTKICVLKKGIVADFTEPQVVAGLHWMKPVEATKNFSGTVLSLFLFQFLVPGISMQVKGDKFWRFYLSGQSTFEKIE